MQMSNHEIGSSFYDIQEGDREYQGLIEHNKDMSRLSLQFFYTGRNAFTAIIQHILSKKNIDTVWLPSYYCDTVIDLFESQSFHLKYYEINPFKFDEEIDISLYNPNEIVIINNFWGMSSFPEYDQAQRPVIIEDHSHGWLSPACMNSKADYCICSLRKTYPIPMGAIAWSPIHDFWIPNIGSEDGIIEQARAQLKTVFKRKRTFLKEGGKMMQNDYLPLLNEAENLIAESKAAIKPNTSEIAIIKTFLKLSPNEVKINNLREVLSRLKPNNKFKIIVREGYVPFGLLLVFENMEILTSFKNSMIQEQVYPALLWPKAKAHGKWKYLLNIHIDFRYDKENMCYLVEKINDWVKNNV